MSPEQIEGHQVDGRSDLFAFGILLHEILTGRHPWPAPSAVDTLYAILHNEPPPIDTTLRVGADLAAVVQRLLRKRAAERYASAEAVLDALAMAADAHGPSTASRASPQILTSIAVLPFVFLSDVEDRRALSLGLRGCPHHNHQQLGRRRGRTDIYDPELRPGCRARPSVPRPRGSAYPAGNRSEAGRSLARVDAAVRFAAAQDHVFREA